MDDIEHFPEAVADVIAVQRHDVLRADVAREVRYVPFSPVVPQLKKELDHVQLRSVVFSRSRFSAEFVNQQVAFVTPLQKFLLPVTGIGIGEFTR